MNITELTPGKTYLVKVTAESYNSESFISMMSQCKEKNIKVIALMVKNENEVSIQETEHMLKIVQIDWTEVIAANFNVIGTHMVSKDKQSKVGAVSSGLSTVIRNKIKQVMADAKTS